MNDARIGELFDTLTPSYDDRQGDWERVVAASAAPSGRRAHARWAARLAPAAAVVAALAALALAWPFQGEQGGVLERALAAIGDGPVLHVVLRGEWGGTLVDLETGARSPVHGETEVWYDRAAGRVHSIVRLGNVVQHEEVYEPREPPPELEALGHEYREALESGRARVAEEGTLDGEPVVWITIRSELLPDDADGRKHKWEQQVAVSRTTFEPVALRDTRDGKSPPFTGQRVLDLELLPAGEGDFTASKRRQLDGTAFQSGREPIPLEQAEATLGRTPYWLGREYGGLPLAQAYRATTSVGTRQEVEVTGPDAEAALRCTKLRGEEGADCFRSLGRSLGQGSLTVRPDGVFRTVGPIVWREEERSLVLFYGELGDDPSTYREDTVPLWDRPHLTITQTTQPSALARPGTGGYVPREGAVFLAAGGRTGVLRVAGVHIAIEAASEEEILAAARALVPIDGS